MLKVEIAGTEYDNISRITPIVETDVAYDVQTMDGVRHRSVKGTKTNYEILFYNKNHEQYEQLKEIIKERANMPVMLTVPINSTETETDRYFVSFDGDELKGVLMDGKHYYTGLLVRFDKVKYDE